LGSVKQAVKAALEVNNEYLQDSYLGMPTEIARSAMASFKFLPDRVWKSVTGWSDRPLSRAGKETKLKSVTQSIANYVMSCFQVSVGTCNKMKSYVANDWWGMEDGKRKLHWRSWDWLTTPKSLGGMGFRDFVLFNQAMLGKQAWRLLTETSSLCTRVLKGRYFPDTDFLSANKPRSSSYTWRSILFGRELLLRGLIWGVGNGELISIMGDSWVPGFRAGTFATVNDLPSNAKVKFLFNDDADGWNMEKVRHYFYEPMAQVIQQIPISRHGGEDYATWPHSKPGLYTVRSAYHLARTERVLMKQSAGKGDSSDSALQEKSWKSIWAINCPNKMKIILWRMAHDCLATGIQLQKRNIPTNDHCLFCGRSESVEHLFLHCTFASAIWAAVKEHTPFSLDRGSAVSMRSWLF
jgi:hypothetical protein